MKIGIDVSQTAYGNTGVSNFLSNLVLGLIENDRKNEYVLFFSSMRKSLGDKLADLDKYSNVSIKKFKLPQSFLNMLWNKLHVLPIENFIGNVDLFITSDWTEPPAKKAMKATVIYDMIVYKYPAETEAGIVKTQKNKLKWVKKESDIIFCISKSTKKDLAEILEIPEKKLKVIYPGISKVSSI